MYRSPIAGWYEGDMKFGLQHGFGSFVTVGGERYEGFWHQGLRHGMGKYTFKDGSTLQCDWVRDKVSKGVLRTSLGVCYSGEFVDGAKVGFGIMTWPTGERYMGSWKANKRSGLGFFRGPPISHGVSSGTTFFTGQFKEGNKYGAGSLSLRDGSTLHGIFVNDNLVQERAQWEEEGAVVYSDGEGTWGEWLERKVDPLAIGEGERQADNDNDMNDEDEDEDEVGGILSEFRDHFVISSIAP